MKAVYSSLTVTSDLGLFRPAVMPREGGNQDLAETLGDLGDFFTSLGKLASRYNGGECGCQCGVVEPPAVEDCRHPQGSLRVDQESDVITTPGGYEIEQVGQYEWKITGPDGEWTRIWGDPHVQEGDRSGKESAWDFKRDSTFVLPDGTRINVTTKKASNDMTVTSQLEVINGDDRVLVTDIDKGKGQVGEVTQDGDEHRDSFAGKEVFMMGDQADDWYLHGREVLASFNGGESFDLGESRSQNFLDSLQGFLQKLFESLFNDWRCGTDPEVDRPRERVADDLRALGDMFRTIAGLRSLSDQVRHNRGFQLC